MKIDKEFLKSLPFNCHSFCDALRKFGKDHGGSAHSNWYALYFYKGVFIGYHNHDFCILALTDPDAKFTYGCQDSCCYGNPLPKPTNKDVKIRSYLAMPEETHQKIIELAREAIKEVGVLVEKMQEEENIERNKKQKEGQDVKNNIIEAWGKVK